MKTWTLKNERDNSPVTITILKAGLLNGIDLKYTAYDWDREVEFASGSYQTLERILQNGIDEVIKDDEEARVREEIVYILTKTWTLKRESDGLIAIIKIRKTREFIGISMKYGFTENHQSLESMLQSGIQGIIKDKSEEETRNEIINLLK